MLGGTRRKRIEQQKYIYEKLTQDDALIREVADTIIQLRVTAENLELAMKKLREEEEEESNG